MATGRVDEVRGRRGSSEASAGTARAMRAAQPAQPRAASLSRVITVDTSRSKSNAEVVRLCLQQLGWKDYPDGRPDGRPCDIYWHNLHYPDVKTKVLSGSKVNKFPGMNELSRKIHLAKALQSLQRLFPTQFDFCPRSWFIPSQLNAFYEDYYATMERRSSQVPWFIVKPDEGAQGCGIYLIHSPEQLANLDQPQLIQEYVAEPFLLGDGLKFDLRVYAVVRSLNPLSIYVAREGMARFCTQKYRLPSSSNSDQVYMHLTNFSLNKASEGFVHAQDVGEEGSKRLLSSVFHQLQARGVNTKKLWHKIKLIVVKTMLAMVPDLILHYEHHFASATGSLQGPSCFQILGFDILLTKDAEPILLEINACPSLTMSQELPAQSSEDKENVRVLSVVDEAIKMPLVRDTLLLVAGQLGPSARLSSAASQRSSHDDAAPAKPSLREVFPARYAQTCGHLLVLDRAAYLFMHFITVKRTLLMSSSAFKNFLRKCHLGTVWPGEESDQEFAKAAMAEGGGKTEWVAFHGFVALLTRLAVAKFGEESRAEESPKAAALSSLLHFCQTQLRHSGVRSASLRNATLPDGQVFLLPNRLPKTLQGQTQPAKAKPPRIPSSVSLPRIT